MIPERKNRFAYLLIALMATAFDGCRPVSDPSPESRFAEDSMRIERLLDTGDSIYSRRNGMSTIAESLIYFDSAHGMARRLGDTLLLARTLYFTGNVYNAWNQEPLTTIRYYQKASDLYNRLPAQQNKAFYVRYILAHAYDGEKADDSLHCAAVLQSALTDLQQLPDTLRKGMNFISDFAWVATNIKAYRLAEAFLQIVPREAIGNDPEMNNYLDHYYLTRCRLDIWWRGKNSTPYLDSLHMALATCGNRYDSAYYSSNLSKLYEGTGNAEAALRFSRLDQTISSRLTQNDILNGLRQELLNRDLQNEREKRRTAVLELRARNLMLFGSAAVLLLAVLLYSVYRKRAAESAERKQQETFTRQLLQKEEDERRRVAADLHDGINHELLALKNNLLLQKPVTAGDMEAVIASVREVSRNLYPVLFESVGLQNSLQALCERFTAAGFFTTSDIQYEPVLTLSEELHLYRIVQEALNNIARHAGAEAAKVTIRTEAHTLHVEIKDNGKGFSMAQGADAGSGFGLKSIRQRAAVIGAALTIQSNAKGTVVELKKSY